MLHMQFLSLAMCLVDKSKDGDLTMDEITQCMGHLFPDKASAVATAVRDAMADGKITVWEVFQILMAVLK